MDAQELRRIEQRLVEGYYDADAEALRTMKQLIEELRRGVNFESNRDQMKPIPPSNDKKAEDDE